MKECGFETCHNPGTRQVIWRMPYDPDEQLTHGGRVCDDHVALFDQYIERLGMEAVII